jgi:hypothetical protein
MLDDEEIIIEADNDNDADMDIDADADIDSDADVDTDADSDADDDDDNPPYPFYYGYITDGWGFIDNTDSRVDTIPDLIGLTQEEHMNLLNGQAEGLEIVSYDNQVFCADKGVYYVDENNTWQKHTDEDIEAEKIKNAKADKILENDTLRDEALNAGVTYKNVLFDSDTDQKTNLMAMVSLMCDDDVITWFGKDNQPLTCTKEDLLNIGGLIIQLHSFCWAKNAEIKLLISEAETVEQIEEIVINYDDTAITAE